MQKYLFHPFKTNQKALFCLFILTFLTLSWACKDKSDSVPEINFLNVSFDPTRELYAEINTEFGKLWSLNHKSTISFQQSHGGSGKQARSVIDGLQADVVTLALSYDIDSIVEKSGLISKDWESKFPNNSSPYFSTVVLLVRKGNPKNIRDWDDIIKDSVSIITPNPKTSGGARWNYLAAYAYAKEKTKSNDKAKEFISKLYKNTSVLDTGARASTTTFIQRSMGDVLITWENEALLALKESNTKEKNFEIIYPSVSILAETPVAIVEVNAKKKQTLDIATSYIEFLYSEQGQEIIAKNFLRPRSEVILQKYKNQFPKIKMVSIRDLEGSWKEAQLKHFSDNGIFDQIYKK
ncbi:MAG: sulfate ABC transporter substrate-binding protein [Leptospiraceae bacterium]|nr:sulfate ABC transporter substrate-binding protein [Leptospiraceae bacterium]MCZ8346754.1 sulfate ABC transporter substrate-binding protein [Leptospiraceae bacterium]